MIRAGISGGFAEGEVAMEESRAGDGGAGGQGKSSGRRRRHWPEKYGSVAPNQSPGPVAARHVPRRRPYRVSARHRLRARAVTVKPSPGRAGMLFVFRKVVNSYIFNPIAT